MQKIEFWKNYLTKKSDSENLSKYLEKLIAQGYTIENVIPTTYMTSVGGQYTELKSATIILNKQ